MKVGVVGLGHVGLVTAACLAEVGHDVTGVDSDAEKVERLSQAAMPFFEPGLEELVRRGLDAGRLHLEDEPVALADTEVLFICIGTPPAANGAADLLELEELAAGLAEHLASGQVVVEKSTVPVTTADRLSRAIERYRGAGDVQIASNPEFLREGRAVEDTLTPSRIVIGASSDRTASKVLDVFRPMVEAGAPVIVTDVRTAELIKHASNAFLATKISFINAVADICERAGADVGTVADGMGLDPRIGRAFLDAGLGYGGACLPKDVSGFVALAEELGCELDLLREVQAINERRADAIVEKLRRELWHLSGKTIAALGLAFKPGTDDVRDSPALRVVRALLSEGARVVAYDPACAAAAKELIPEMDMAPCALDAADGADAAVILTEWDEFRHIQPVELRDALRFPIVVDGRNVFDPAEMAAAGFTYLSVGRAPARAA